MGRLDKKDRGAGAGAGETLQYVRGNYRSFEGTNLTVGCRGNASLYITCLVLFIILADLMLLIGVVYITIFRCGIQRVIPSWCVVVH